MSPPGRWEQSYDPVALGKMKAHTINATAGTLTGYDCKQCLNRGSIAHVRPDGSLVFKPCACESIRRCVMEMERSGLKNIIKELTFEAFTVKEDWQNTLKQGVMRYAANMEGWLLLCGQSGCGKTHLCTAVCRQQLLGGKEVRYMPWRDEVAQIKACSLDSPHRQQLLDGYKNAGILYIDDLFKVGGAEQTGNKPTAADVGIAFDILNHRYLGGLATIISTEYSPQELAAIDEAVGGRIVQMAGEHIYAVGKDVRRNYRLRKVKLL